MAAGQTAEQLFKASVDNSVAGTMRDCGECHVGGGMMEYRQSGINADTAALVQYDPNQRTALRTGGIAAGVYTAWNYLIDIFNPAAVAVHEKLHHTPAIPVTDPAEMAAAAAGAGAAVFNDFAATGVVEMDCLMCHQKDYNWHARRDVIRAGKFDASRAIGAGLATAAPSGTTVTYDATKIEADSDGNAVINLSTTMISKPDSKNCANCHMSEYNVDWKKRGEVFMNLNANADGFEWLNGKDAHMAIGCMGCHERTGINQDPITGADIVNAKGAAIPRIGVVGKSGINNGQLGLCDPAKGGASPFDAMWNSVDKIEFKDCTGCHSAKASDAVYKASGLHYNAPNAFAAHSSAGLTRKSAYTAAGVAASHIDIMDCAVCHIKKTGITGGAFVDGSGADEQGRVALHDNPFVAKDMEDGVAVHWQKGKLHATNLLSSMFVRDVNGLKVANGGLDINNDGREAGLDVLLQTHLNNINLAKGKASIYTDGVVNAAEVKALFSDLTAGLPAQLGLVYTVDQIKAANADDTPNLLATNAFLPKLSWMMVPFKNSHNIAWAKDAKGAGGCKDCHAANAGFYNGAYPINGGMAKAATGSEARYASGKKVVAAAADTNLTFKSSQVTRFTKVNGLSDFTDSHPNVMNKKNNRTVPVEILKDFDNPYTPAASTVVTFMRDIDRSEVIYEKTFQTIIETYSATAITGSARPAACSGSTSPFYCETVATADPVVAGLGGNINKKGATATTGWLLKIDTKKISDGTLVSRTKQIFSDKITNTAGIVANLAAVPPTGATGTGDFTNTPEFTIAKHATEEKLVITPKAGYEIRINKATDVGPFGLGGALWTPDPIERTDADAVAFVTAKAADTTNYGLVAGPKAQFKTRAGYVAYLDSIAAAPVAAIGSVGAVTTVGTNVTVNTDTAVNFTAADQGNPNFEYSWKFSDSAEIFLGKTAPRTFTKPVNVMATLLVKNTETGQIAAKKLLVFVKKNFPATTGATVTRVVGRKVSLAVSNVSTPVTKIQVLWGDGTSSSYKTTSTGYNATHTYYGAASTFSGRVKVINGATVKDEKVFVTDFDLI